MWASFFFVEKANFQSDMRRNIGILATWHLTLYKKKVLHFV
jgi:hypothetical protein